MDNVSSCLEHIQFLLRAGGGIITNEQIQLLLISHDLDEDEQQKKRLFELLEENKIFPISEEELHPKVQGSNIPTQPQVEHKEIDKQMRDAQCNQCFNRMLDEYKQATKENPDIIKQYEEEILVFADAIVEQYRNISKTSRIITKAVMAVSSYRVREVRKRGWTCGTHMRYVREHFESWVKSVFTEEELSELIGCFVQGKKLTCEQENMVRILLHNTPKTPVNRWSFFDD